MSTLSKTMAAAFAASLLLAACGQTTTDTTGTDVSSSEAVVSSEPTVVSSEPTVVSSEAVVSSAPETSPDNVK